MLSIVVMFLFIGGLKAYFVALNFVVAVCYL